MAGLQLFDHNSPPPSLFQAETDTPRGPPHKLRTRAVWPIAEQASAVASIIYPGSSTRLEVYESGYWPWLGTQLDRRWI
jgi:hypothetical protein